METVSDFLSAHRDEVSTALNEVGGWRGLFDPYCAEWQEADLRQKAGVLRLLMQHRTFPQLVAIFLNSERREYIRQDVPCAIFKLMDHLPEAKEFFLNDPICVNSVYHECLTRKLDAERWTAPARPSDNHT
jgi:hypothetical protein